MQTLTCHSGMALRVERYFMLSDLLHAPHECQEKETCPSHSSAFNGQCPLTKKSLPQHACMAFLHALRNGARLYSSPISTLLTTLPQEEGPRKSWFYIYTSGLQIQTSSIHYYQASLVSTLPLR